MDNVTKALLIAAGVLIAIIIVALGIRILGSGQDNSQSAKQLGDELNSGTQGAIGAIKNALGNNKSNKEPGLYDSNGNKIKTWDELVEGQYVTINNGELNGKRKYMGYFYLQELGENLTLIIADNVTSITDNAFQGCQTLKNITISDSVTSIGRYAFSGCNSLTSITIPGTVTSMDVGAFDNCTELETVIMQKGLKSIVYGTFEGCKKLANITIPNSVTKIEDFAFKNCTSLTEIAIPNSIISIGYCAFQRMCRLSKNRDTK